MSWVHGEARPSSQVEQHDQVDRQSPRTREAYKSHQIIITTISTINILAGDLVNVVVGRRLFVPVGGYTQFHTIKAG